jgi:hypothetical protein
MVLEAAVLARWHSAMVWAMIGNGICFTLLGGGPHFLSVDNCYERQGSSLPEESRHGSCCPSVENAWPTAQRHPPLF